jgi:hypothetical protein
MNSVIFVEPSSNFGTIWIKPRPDAISKIYKKKQNMRFLNTASFDLDNHRTNRQFSRTKLVKTFTNYQKGRLPTFSVQQTLSTYNVIFT